MIKFFLIQVIRIFCNVLVTLIIVQAIMSWFQMYFSPGVRKAYEILTGVTEPFISPFRNLLKRLMPMSMIDFSPILAILAIQLIGWLLIVLLSHLYI